jgi:ATP synthase protein I
MFFAMHDPLKHGSPQRTVIVPQAAQKSLNASSEWVQSELVPHDDADFVALTPEQALSWRLRHCVQSPWRMVLVQTFWGVLSAFILGVMTSSSAVLWSALYGVLIVSFPGALLAQGIRPVKKKMASAMAANFLFWELVKMVVALVLLLLAVKLVPNLNWLALLAGMLVCMKVGWLALLRRS